jgi:ElaB/YqjD/DUF883 family membrane-anchored ribosome-binding protein
LSTNFIRKKDAVMSGSSRFGQLASAQAGEIEQRLQTLEKKLTGIGARASTNSRDIVGDLSEVIASALSTWADRFREGAGTVGDQSAALGKDAARLGTMAIDRIGDESRRRPLVAVAVALGVGVLVGMALRASSR